MSDCHTTVDYLEENNVDIDNYYDKLSAIMQKFDLVLDGKVFRKIIYNSDNDFDLCRGVGYFIEAVALIAHIDL